MRRGDHFWHQRFFCLLGFPAPQTQPFCVPSVNTLTTCAMLFYVFNTQRSTSCFTVARLFLAQIIIHMQMSPRAKGLLPSTNTIRLSRPMQGTRSPSRERAKMRERSARYRFFGTVANPNTVKFLLPRLLQPSHKFPYSERAGKKRRLIGTTLQQAFLCF